MAMANLRRDLRRVFVIFPRAKRDPVANEVPNNGNGHRPAVRLDKVFWITAQRPWYLAGLGAALSKPQMAVTSGWRPTRAPPLAGSGASAWYQHDASGEQPMQENRSGNAPGR